MADMPESESFKKERNDAILRRRALVEAGCSTYILFATCQPAIRCLCCGMASWHPEDIRQKYCGFCHSWHSEESLQNSPTK